MKYTPDEVMQFVREADVKFIRLAFCDVFGKQRNIAVMADELSRAFEQGIAFDASAIDGFGGEVKSDLFLRPDPSTLQQLPWRPQQGGVARLFCDITHPDGSPFEADTRYILKKSVEAAKEKGIGFFFGSEIEFYLFRLDENGERTLIPYDNAGYMDIAPDDKGENVRREICLTLEQMGIHPESSHHESGPGQNEIDFRYAAPLTAADDAVTFRAVVKTLAALNGLYADFSPKPLPDRDGSGMHINISAKRNGEPVSPKRLVSGVLERICDMTLFLNPCENSYERLGRDKAPAYVTWSEQNRSQLIRIPAAFGEYRRAELRSPDPGANPYLAFALIIRACLNGLENGTELPPEADFNTFTASQELLEGYKKLPSSLGEAFSAAAGSEFIRQFIPASVIDAYGR
jgi:glutamine synthetase